MSGEPAGERLLVIGVGHPDRADDAVGPWVANRVRAEEGAAGARVITRSGDMLALIDDWTSSDAAVLIDAAAPSSQPGQIHRVDVTCKAMPQDLRLSSGAMSTHAFGVVEAIELSRTLRKLPARLIVYVIEGACFEAGGALTPAVAAAAEIVTQRVLAELRDLRRVGDRLHA